MHPVLEEPPLVQRREAEGALLGAQAELLDAPADTAGERPEVLAPVPGRPDLVPVDDEPVAPPPAHRRRGEQREVRERGRVQHVVLAAVPDEMAEHAEAEDERRQDPPPAVRVQVELRADRDDPDAGNLRRGVRLPLAQGQVGDLVTVVREPLREVAVPALGTADGVREEAVVDEADAHALRVLGRLLVISERAEPQPWHRVHRGGCTSGGTVCVIRWVRLSRDDQETRAAILPVSVAGTAAGAQAGRLRASPARTARALPHR